MVFCSSCGKKLPENAYFCPRCGVITRIGVKVGVGTPWDELRDAFSKMGEEMEKAFATAGREIEKAFKTTREKIRETTNKESVVCSHCGEKNVAGARFCCKCGKKLN